MVFVDIFRFFLKLLYSAIFVIILNKKQKTLLKNAKNAQEYISDHAVQLHGYYGYSFGETSITTSLNAQKAITHWQENLLPIKGNKIIEAAAFLNNKKWGKLLTHTQTIAQRSINSIAIYCTKAITAGKNTEHMLEALLQELSFCWHCNIEPFNSLKITALSKDDIQPLLCELIGHLNKKLSKANSEQEALKVLDFMQLLAEKHDSKPHIVGQIDPAEINHAVETAKRRQSTH